MAITTSVPYEPFTPERYSAQTPRNIAWIEQSQFNAYEMPATQPQPKVPIVFQPPYPVFLQPTHKNSSPDPLTVIALVGLLGLFGLFAFLAYTKR